MIFIINTNYKIIFDNAVFNQNKDYALRVIYLAYNVYAIGGQSGGSHETKELHCVPPCGGGVRSSEMLVLGHRASMFIHI